MRKLRGNFRILFIPTIGTAGYIVYHSPQATLTITIYLYNWDAYGYYSQFIFETRSGKWVRHPWATKQKKTMNR